MKFAQIWKLLYLKFLVRLISNAKSVPLKSMLSICKVLIANWNVQVLKLFSLIPEDVLPLLNAPHLFKRKDMSTSVLNNVLLIKFLLLLQVKNTNFVLIANKVNLLILLLKSVLPPALFTMLMELLV